MATFGDVLRKRIKEKGYTQEEFADEIGIGKSTLTKYMNGTRTYTIDILELFAEKLDCSYDYLMGYSKVPERKHQDIRDNIRLSISAIDRLEEWAKDYDTDNRKKLLIDTISALIEQDKVFAIADIITGSKNSKWLMNNMLKKMPNNELLNGVIEDMAKDTNIEVYASTNLYAELKQLAPYFAEHYPNKFDIENELEKLISGSFAR